MTDTLIKRHPNAHYCYVCGTKQEDGLHVEFLNLHLNDF